VDIWGVKGLVYDACVFLKEMEGVSLTFVVQKIMVANDGVRDGILVLAVDC
jgi:hypothetical protein